MLAEGAAARVEPGTQPAVRSTPHRARFRGSALSSVGYAAAVLAVVVPIVLSRAAYGALPVGPDQGLFITIGEMIDRGAVPWRDAWDNKPPGPYYLYGGVMALTPDYSRLCDVPLTPIVAGEPLSVSCAQFALSALDTLIALGTAAGLWWCGHKMFGTAAGALAAVLFAIFASTFELARGGGLPDSQALLPQTVAFAATIAYAQRGKLRWLVVAGALCAVAALFKQTSGIALLAIGAWVVIARLPELGTRASGQVTRGVIALVAGAVLVFALIGLIFGWLGALSDLVSETITANLRYVASPPVGDSFLSRAVKQSFKVFSDSQSGLWVAAVGAFPLLPGAAHRQWRPALLVAWSAGAALSVAAGNTRFNQYYYLALVPPLALAGGWSLATAWGRLPLSGRWWLSAGAATLLMFSSESQAHIVQSAWYLRILDRTPSPEELVAAPMRDATGTLFVWGNGAQVYALSGRPPAARFLQTLALSNDFVISDQVPLHRAELMQRLEQRPPAFIAFDTPWLTQQGTLPFRELDRYVQESYTLANRPDDPAFQGWRLYSRTANGTTPS